MAGDFGTIATGALGGAGAGAAVGSAIFPGIGTAIGAVGGAVIGAIGAKSKLGARDEAMEGVMALPEYDPMQLNFLDQLKREKRSVESGFTTDFQVAKDLNQEMLAGGLSVAESVASTNPALGLSYLDTASKRYTTGINQALGTISGRSLGYTSGMGELIDKISQRKLDVQTYKAVQKLGLTTDTLQTSNVNTAQFAGRLPQYMDDFSKVPGQFNSIFGNTPPVGTPAAVVGQGSNFDFIMNQTASRQVAPALSLSR